MSDQTIFICPVCEAVIEGDQPCPNGPHTDVRPEPTEPNRTPDTGERTTYLRVVWNDHGHDPEPDWAYHLRMGGVDCDEAEVVEGRHDEQVKAENERLRAALQAAERRADEAALRSIEASNPGIDITVEYWPWDRRTQEQVAASMAALAGRTEGSDA